MSPLKPPPLSLIQLFWKPCQFPYASYFDLQTKALVLSFLKMHTNFEYKCIFEWDGCVSVSKVHFWLYAIHFVLCVVHWWELDMEFHFIEWSQLYTVLSPYMALIVCVCGIYWYSSTSNTSNFHPWIQVTSHQWLHERKQAQSLTRIWCQCLEPALLIRSLIIKKPFAFVCVSCMRADTCLSCVNVCVFLSVCMSGLLKCKWLYVYVSVCVSVCV